MRSRGLAFVALLLAAACGSAAGNGPADLDTRHDRCARCRMGVSSIRTAAQIVATGEEPVFFDDLGCLGSWLHAGHSPGADAAIYVADHRTGAWVEAETAIFTRVADLETPMGSGLVAHRDQRSRGQDPVAERGTPVTAAEALGRVP